MHHADNGSFSNFYGTLEIEAAPPREAIMKAFSGRQHIFLRVRMPTVGVVRKVHLEIEGISYMDQVSKTALLLKGHLRGDPLRKTLFDTTPKDTRDQYLSTRQVIDLGELLARFFYLAKLLVIYFIC